MTVAGRAYRAARSGRAVPQAGLLVGGLVLLAAVAVLSMGVGARHVPPAEVVRALLDYRGTDDQVIVRDVRAPRALLAVAVGAALAVSGALIQTLARNPLAEPGILGVTAGAASPSPSAPPSDWPPAGPANWASPSPDPCSPPCSSPRSDGAHPCAWSSPEWR